MFLITDWQSTGAPARLDPFSPELKGLQLYFSNQ